MKTNLAIVLGVAALLLSGQRGFTADAATELDALLKKVNADLSAGKQTELDLAGDLKQFDALLAKHKGEKTDAVARILYMKAKLYGDVLNNDAKAQELFKQLKVDFKGTAFVAQLEKQEAAAAAEKALQDALAIGANFPGFFVTDVMGQTLSVASHKGKVVLIHFWATWNMPSRMELADIIDTYQKYHPQGFDIISISLDQDKAQLLSFIKSESMTWPEYFDGRRWDNKLVVKYGIQAIPANFLLDGEGKIIGKNLRGDDLKQAIVAALPKN
jgi:thiol-disulfide isomerase/thioredoxin